MSVSAPRFRTDLVAARGEAEGVVFYDVTDRATGTTFRMYEVEYLAARELDGRPLLEVASEIARRFGLETDTEELRLYVEKLEQLGFLERRDVDELAGALEKAADEKRPAARPLPSPVRPVTPPAGARSPTPAKPLPGIKPVAPVGRTPPVASAAPPAVRPPPTPAAALSRGQPGKAKPARSAWPPPPSTDAVTEVSAVFSSVETPEPNATPLPPMFPPSAPPATVSREAQPPEGDASAAEDAAPPGVPQNGSSLAAAEEVDEPPPLPAPPLPTRGAVPPGAVSAEMEDLPTTPAVDPVAEFASDALTPILSDQRVQDLLRKAERVAGIPESERATRPSVPALVDLPDEAQPHAEDSAAGAAPDDEPAAASASAAADEVDDDEVDDDEVTREAGTGSHVTASPRHDTAPVAPLPTRPAAAPGRRPRRGTSPLWLAAPLVVVAGLVIGVYLPAHRGIATIPVHVQAVRSETVVRLFPAVAQLHNVEPLKFSFPEAGTLAELRPPGQQVKSGDALAKLEGYDKIEQQIVDLRSREAYYQNELEKAQRAVNGPAIGRAKAKIEEKRGLIAAAQTRYARLVVSSTAPGVVNENLAKVGDSVTPDQPVTQVLPLRLRADFVLPAGQAGSLKAGMITRLEREDRRLVDCRVEKVEEEGDQATVRVEVIDLAAGVKTGDRVKLVRARPYEGVIRLPAGAVVRAGGHDQVFVVQDGKARERVVTVLDRDPQEVLVGQGLAPGDRVITSGTVGLHDGAPVRPE